VPIIDSEEYIYMTKKIIATLIMGLFLVLSAQATMISICVIETGISPEGPKTPNAMQWENALLDVFFDAGYIVTNAPMMRLEEKPKVDIKTVAIQDMNDAVEGGANYFLIAQLDYIPGPVTQYEVSLYLYSTTPYKKIHESKIQKKVYQTEKEEFENAKSAVKGFVPHIKPAF
jgi:hypothetical protein